jgi:type IV pilus assembly protein PilO
MINNLLIRLAALTPKQALFFTLILGALYYFMFFNDGSDLQNKITTVQDQITKEEQKATEADAALKEVEQVRATVGALSEQFKTVSQALPSEVQMSDIIRTVDTVSRASGVSIKSKEPRPVVNKDYYEQIPLKITMEGSYSEITMFLYYLASTERIMKVENFSMGNPNPSDKISPGRLTFEGQVVSYRFVGSTAKAGEGQKK